MHPVFVMIVIGCAAWFFFCAAAAGRGIAVRFGSALLGVVAFFVGFVAFDQIMRRQDFFIRAIRSGPDFGPIVAYIVIPTAVLVLVSGIVLKRALSRTSPPEPEHNAAAPH